MIVYVLLKFKWSLKSKQEGLILISKLKRLKFKKIQAISPSSEYLYIEIELIIRNSFSMDQ